MLFIKPFLYKAFLYGVLISGFGPGFTVAEQYEFVDVNAHPLGFYDKNQHVKGVAIDIFKRVMVNLGHGVSFELLPGKRVIHLLKEGKVHGVPFIRKTDSRQEFLDYSTEIIISENIYIYVDKDSSFEFSGDFDVFKSQKIAVVLGDTHGEKFNKIAPSLNIVETSSIASSFKMLEKKRVDLVLSTSIRASRELKGKRDKTIIKLNTPVVTVPLYAAFSKKKNLKNLRSEFDKELKKIKKSGEVKRIISQWH